MLASQAAAMAAFKSVGKENSLTLNTQSGIASSRPHTPATQNVSSLTSPKDIKPASSSTYKKPILNRICSQDTSSDPAPSGYPSNSTSQCHDSSAWLSTLQAPIISVSDLSNSPPPIVRRKTPTFGLPSGPKLDPLGNNTRESSPQQLARSENTPIIAAMAAVISRDAQDALKSLDSQLGFASRALRNSLVKPLPMSATDMIRSVKQSIENNHVCNLKRNSALYSPQETVQNLKESLKAKTITSANPQELTQKNVQIMTESRQSMDIKLPESFNISATRTNSGKDFAAAEPMFFDSPCSFRNNNSSISALNLTRSSSEQSLYICFPVVPNGLVPDSGTNLAQGVNLAVLSIQLALSPEAKLLLKALVLDENEKSIKFGSAFSASSDENRSYHDKCRSLSLSISEMKQLHVKQNSPKIFEKDFPGASIPKTNEYLPESIGSFTKIPTTKMLPSRTTFLNTTLFEMNTPTNTKYQGSTTPLAITNSEKNSFLSISSLEEDEHLDYNINDNSGQIEPALCSLTAVPISILTSIQATTQSHVASSIDETSLFQLHLSNSKSTHMGSIEEMPKKSKRRPPPVSETPSAIKESNPPPFLPPVLISIHNGYTTPVQTSSQEDVSAISSINDSDFVYELANEQVSSDTSERDVPETDPCSSKFDLRFNTVQVLNLVVRPKVSNANSTNAIPIDSKVTGLILPQMFSLDINRRCSLETVLASKAGQTPFNLSKNPVKLKTTMRDTKNHRRKNKNAFNENKPWKYHNELTYLSEQERKRYEGIWTSNKGQYVENLATRLIGVDYNSESQPSRPEAAQLKAARISTTSVAPKPNEHDALHVTETVDASELIVGVVVRRLWMRSRLPFDTLESIWTLVDSRLDGTLCKAEFLVGLWLVDQCLYGRKLPKKVDRVVWEKLGGIGVNVVVKKGNR